MPLLRPSPLGPPGTDSGGLGLLSRFRGTLPDFHEANLIGLQGLGAATRKRQSDGSSGFHKAIRTGYQSHPRTFDEPIILRVTLH